MAVGTAITIRWRDKRFSARCAGYPRLMCSKNYAFLDPFFVETSEALTNANLHDRGNGWLRLNVMGANLYKKK